MLILANHTTFATSQTHYTLISDLEAWARHTHRHQVASSQLSNSLSLALQHKNQVPPYIVPLIEDE